MIAQGNPQITTNVGTVKSVTITSGELDVQSGGVLATTGDLTNFNVVIEDGASVTVGGTLANFGALFVDLDYGFGGGILSIAGVLSNSGNIYLGNNGLSASDRIRASSLSNVGSIYLQGGTIGQGNGDKQALLDIAGPAGFGTAGVLSGNVYLAGNSAINFASGGITSIAAGSWLDLNGAKAVVETGATGTNNALGGLATIESGATLNIANGASITTTGALTNFGSLQVDDYYFMPEGSNLTIGGALTNSGTVSFGNFLLSVSSTIHTAGLVNTGLVSVNGGSAANTATFATSGMAENNGSIITNAYGRIRAGSFEQDGGALVLGLAGTAAGQYATLTATGSVSLGGGALRASVDGFNLAAGQTFTLASFASGGLTGIFDTLRSNQSGNIGDGTSLDLGTGLTLGLVYNDQAGNIQLKVVATPGNTADTWTAGTGNWSTNANWSNGAPTFYSDVIIGTLSTAKVTLDVDASIDSLVINANDALTTKSGTDLSIGSTITLASGAAFVVGGKAFADGDAVNNGTITAQGKILEIRGSVTGTGSLAIGSNATLELDGASAQTVSFNGTSGTLALENSAIFSGTLFGLEVGDTIDLADRTATSATVNGAVLTIGDDEGNLLHYNLAQFQAGGSFAIQADGQGGSNLVVTQSVPPVFTVLTATPTAGALGVGRVVVLTLTVSEAVTVTGTPTLVLNDGGVATFDKAASTGTSLVFNYTVAVGQNTGSLVALSVDLKGGVIENAFGTDANLSLAGLTQAGPEIDTARPRIASITETASASVLGVGGNVTITLTTNETLFGGGGTGPTLSLNDGGVATFNLAKSTATSFAFDYTVSAGQNTAALAVTAINLNGGSAQDAAGNVLDVSLAGLTQAGPRIDTSAFMVTAAENLEIPSAFAVTTTSAVSNLRTSRLDQSTLLAGRIPGPSGDDTLDLADIAFGTRTTIGYSGNSAGGTLSASDGAHSAKTVLLGNYLASTFVASGDGHGGTQIVDPQPAGQAFLTLPHLV